MTLFADFLGIGGFVSGIFGTLGHAVLGAFSWTVGLASKFILITLGALVRLLIPRSWAQDGVQIMRWIVAVPDYAGQITTPGGGHAYGFGGVNDLRLMFEWIGIALLPLTLVYASSRAAIGRGDHVGAPVVRVLSLAVVLLGYTLLWSQGAAMVNQLTAMILSPAPVVNGLHKLMLYATDGVALGGWQLVDLGLMAAIALELLGLIFLKVALILLGALLFATGPLMIGIVATEVGSALARAWASAVFTFLVLPVAWSAVFAVGAVLINDAGTAGPLVAGDSGIGHLLGGVILAISGCAALWLCLKAGKEAGGLLRVQIGGLLALTHGRSRGSSSPFAAQAGHGQGVRSIRRFQTRVGAAAAAAGAELAASGRVGERLAGVAGMSARTAHRGLIRTAAHGSVRAAGSAARATAQSRLGRAAAPRVAAAAAAAAIPTDGVVEKARRTVGVGARVGRAGAASWRRTKPRQTQPQSGTQAVSATPAAPSAEPARPSRQSAPAPSAMPRGAQAGPESRAERGNTQRSQASAHGRSDAKRQPNTPADGPAATPGRRPHRGTRRLPKHGQG